MILVPAPAKVLAALGSGNSNLALLPPSQTVGLNTSFSVDVQVQTNNNSINVVQFYLDFDPAKLTVSSITAAAAWNGNTVTILENSFDSVTGQINFAGGVSGVTVKGNIPIATINFVAKAATVDTRITFHFSPPPQRDTNVYGGPGDSFLGTATGASLTVTSEANPVTPTPGQTNVTPNPPSTPPPLPPPPSRPVMAGRSRA